ncbi:MAG TPA: signal peptide peptidase SppA [Caldithrix abyssi]|uniref:Signal peptide peptidase SppA n=1 Tax=Caldithrix abyssi TaxID=187145 RepID=A0A7V5VFD2_CALAY|nr:signal peptide peptidase SppA [Caldithrix abyssi]
MKSFFKYLLVLVSGFVILFLMLFLVISSLASTEPVVPDEAYLHISLSGALPDFAPSDPLQELTESRPLSLQSLRDVLEKAAVDERIKATVIYFNFPQLGMAQIEELRDAIARYRESGKKIYAQLPMGFTRDYLLAAACDSVYMPVTANLFLTGISSEISHYKDLLGKIGVEAEYVHAGAYKTAPEQYTRAKASGAQKEVMNRLLDQMFEAIIAMISSSRDMDPKKVRELIDKTSGFTGRMAEEVGLIDRARALRILEERFKQRGWEKISARNYARIPVSSLGIRNKERIAVIEVQGVIAGGSNSDDPFLGTVAGSDDIIRDINKAVDSRSTAAIILRIDSPGGSAIHSDAIYEAVRHAAEKKPVIATIGDYGASGGYYVALAADTIIANPLSLVGSIGVFAGKFNLKGLNNKIGVGVDQITRGENASLFSTNSRWSASERRIMQGLIDRFYKYFVQLTATHRKLDYEQADKVAQGRVWSGKEGHEKGLLDMTGNFYTAVALAKESAGIPETTSVRLVYFPREKKLFAELFSFMSKAGNLLNLWQSPLEKLINDYQNRTLLIVPYKISWK